MSRIRRWLKRRADTASVRYSRFGLPGEEQDDTVQPDKVHVAMFNEHHPDFYILRYIHVRNAAQVTAYFGSSMLTAYCVLFILRFNWQLHGMQMNAAAYVTLFSIFVYMYLNHYHVLVGIKKGIKGYLVFFIFTYSVLIVMVLQGIAFFGVTCIEELYRYEEISERLRHDQLSRGVDPVVLYDQAPYESNAAFYKDLITKLLITECFLSVMLYVVYRCYVYLRRKELHALEMKVAERVQNENPGLRIVIGAERATAPGNSSVATSEQSRVLFTVNDEL